MKREEVIKFANENKVCFIATVYDNKPHVKAMPLWYADETGLYFEVLATDNLSKHLHLNPNIEVCFVDRTDDVHRVKEMRLVSSVEFIDNDLIIDEAYKSEPVLDEFIYEETKPTVEVFRIVHGNARLVQLESDGLRERTMDRLYF